MAVKRSPVDDHHAFLAFSFEVSNSTEVLSIDGTHFRPVSLPGLVTVEASKLITTAAGGWLVQATMRVLLKTGPAAVSSLRPHVLLRHRTCVLDGSATLPSVVLR